MPPTFVPPNRSPNLMYPPFRAQVLRGLDKAHAQNIFAYIFEGGRLKGRQAYLYSLGRTNPGKIVTNAGEGLSTHEYGVGTDLVFDGSSAAGIQWSWEGDYADSKQDDYKNLAVIMKGEGLEWLGDKNIESAHFQNCYGFTVQQMKAIADKSGIFGLWAEFDKKLGL